MTIEQLLKNIKRLAHRIKAYQEQNLEQLQQAIVAFIEFRTKLRVEILDKEQQTYVVKYLSLYFKGVNENHKKPDNWKRRYRKIEIDLKLRLQQQQQLDHGQQQIQQMLSESSKRIDNLNLMKAMLDHDTSQSPASYFYHNINTNTANSNQIQKGIAQVLAFSMNNVAKIKGGILKMPSQFVMDHVKQVLLKKLYNCYGYHKVINSSDYKIRQLQKSGIGAQQVEYFLIFSEEFRHNLMKNSPLICYYTNYNGQLLDNLKMNMEQNKKLQFRSRLTFSTGQNQIRVSSLQNLLYAHEIPD